MLVAVGLELRRQNPTNVTPEVWIGVRYVPECVDLTRGRESSTLWHQRLDKADKSKYHSATLNYIFSRLFAGFV